MTLGVLGELFEHSGIPIDRWNHRMHILVAVYALTRYPAATALRRVREGILRLNERHGASGYHETITVFWMSVLAARLVREAVDLQWMCDDVLACIGDCLDKEQLGRFYSRELLATAAARERFVAPDRSRLP